MKIELLEIREIEIPLISAFRTSQSVQTTRRAMLVRLVTPDSEGWADLTVLPEPVFGHEFVAATWVAVRDLVAPALVGQSLEPATCTARLNKIVGHPAVKSAVEAALLDAQLRAAGISLASYLGGVRDRVPVGVSVGLADTVAELLDVVRGYLSDGYQRIKLKIQPGWDVEPVAAVRREFGDSAALQVDGNGAYSPEDLRQLCQLDEFGLTMIEQPFPTEDLRSHTRLAARIATPVCLDESIKSAAGAATAIEAGACQIVNIKPARVGGYLEARRVHDVCQALGVPVWCGGMLESGVGRAANLALATLPNFAFPSDISATARYFARDITAPFELVDGSLEVPQGAGIGIRVDREALDTFTVARETYGPLL